MSEGPPEKAARTDAAGTPRCWPTLSLSSTLADLPPVRDKDVYLSEVRESIRAGRAPKLVVLDDDPTGTQTVQQIVVLTEWSESSLTKQLTSPSPGFFILTNSRALPTEEASALTEDICKSVRAAAEASGVRCTIVLRGDSTLRGHYPAEVDAAAAALGAFDLTVICPFFLQGGRYTIDDVHYVADGDRLQPASETEFAKDKAFGYKESNLCDWVEEKTEGKVRSADVASLSLNDLRQQDTETVQKRILALPPKSVLIVNAAADADLIVFAAILLQVEAAGRRAICRTAASFVSARLGIDTAKNAPLTLATLPKSLSASCGRVGGLIMVGSYVPKSTAQVEVLVEKQGDLLDTLQLEVPQILEEGVDKIAEKTAAKVDSLLQNGRDVLVVTSRKLIHGGDAKESLDIGGKVSACLVKILQNVQTRPRYLLAKGGITSSDLATKGMGAQDALVIGQAGPGIPIWLLGSGSRWSDFPYIVFPGNVGSVDAVATVVSAWVFSPDEHVPPDSFSKTWWQ